MATVSYKNLFQLVSQEIDNRIRFDTHAPYYDQLSNTSISPLVGSSRSDAATADLVTAIQNLLSNALPAWIISGLTVEATDPIRDSVTVSAGKGAIGGFLYELEDNITLTVPFDSSTELFYVTLYKDNIYIEKTLNPDRLTIAKIIVPNPGVTSLVQDTKDSSWNAYIVNFKEFKLYGYNDKFEEDTVELLRDNISPILADNLIGNIRLSEDLKITNTQGTMELDSSELRILSTNDITLAKFNRNGTYFYDDNGIEIARFTTDDAKIGNILVTKNNIGSSNFISENRGFRIEDSGYAEFENVRVRGQISSSVFVQDTISAVGGKLIISNSSILALDINSAQTTITTEDSIFVNNEILRIKDGTNEEYLKITSISNAPTYTVVRGLAGSSYAWNTGTAIVSTGTTNTGFISLDAISNYSPFIDINLRNSLTYNDWTTKVRLGNLSGITDSLYGVLSGYGLYSDNVYLRGKLYAPDIKTNTSGRRIELSEDGLFMYDETGTRNFSVFLDSISGAEDQGDVIIGQIGNENYIKWDDSLGTLILRGSLDATDILAGTITADKFAQLRNTISYTGEDSLDASYPYEIPFRIVTEMLVINSVKLSFKILNFRAYSSGVPSGGGSTTASGGGSTSGSGGGQTSSGTATPSGGGSTSGSTDVGPHSHSISIATGTAGNALRIQSGGGGMPGCTGGGTIYIGPHTITVASETTGNNQFRYAGGTLLCAEGNGSWTTSSNVHDSLPSHSHTVSFTYDASGENAITFNSTDSSMYCPGGGTLNTSVYVQSHTHTTPDHTHSAHTHTVDNHTHTTPNHTHDTPAHAHSLTFGIYEESNSPSISVYIDNGAGYGASIGTYTTDQSDLDITANISGTGWKRIKFTSTTRCRIAAIIECKLDILA